MLDLLPQWKGLPYAECTFETPEVIAQAGGQDALDQYEVYACTFTANNQVAQYLTMLAVYLHTYITQLELHIWTHTCNPTFSKWACFCSVAGPCGVYVCVTLAEQTICNQQLSVSMLAFGCKRNWTKSAYCCCTCVMCTQHACI